MHRLATLHNVTHDRQMTTDNKRKPVA